MERAREKPVGIEKEQRDNRRNDRTALLKERGKEQGPLPEHHIRRHRRRL